MRLIDATCYEEFVQWSLMYGNNSGEDKSLDDDIGIYNTSTFLINQWFLDNIEWLHRTNSIKVSEYPSLVQIDISGYIWYMDKVEPQCISFMQKLRNLWYARH